MIITIDGPTASGKSTIAQLLAEQIGYMYINSGLLYRGVAYIFIKKKIIISVDQHVSQHEIDALFSEMRYNFTQTEGAVIYYYDENITPHLKTADIDLASSIVAMQPFVRQEILSYERTLADDHNVIADGRDCGTVIFPHAQYKFFITANLDVRADRWQRDQRKVGEEFSLEECKRIIDERDRRDRERSISPMKPADDALIIDTSTLSVQEVITELTTIIRA